MRRGRFSGGKCMTGGDGTGIAGCPATGKGHGRTWFPMPPRTRHLTVTREHERNMSHRSGMMNPASSSTFPVNPAERALRLPPPEIPAPQERFPRSPRRPTPYIRPALPLPAPPAPATAPRPDQPTACYFPTSSLRSPPRMTEQSMADTNPSQKGDSLHTAITQPRYYRRPGTPSARRPQPAVSPAHTQRATRARERIFCPSPTRGLLGPAPVANRNPGHRLPVGPGHERRTEPSAPPAPPTTSHKHPDLRPTTQRMAHRHAPTVATLAAGGATAGREPTYECRDSRRSPSTNAAPQRGVRKRGLYNIPCAP